MTNTTTKSAIQLAIANTDGTAASIEAFVMQDHISKKMLIESLDVLCTGYSKTDDKSVLAYYFARSLEMDWDEFTAPSCQVCGLSFDEDVHDGCIDSSTYVPEEPCVSIQESNTGDSENTVITPFTSDSDDIKKQQCECCSNLANFVFLQEVEITDGSTGEVTYRPEETPVFMCEECEMEFFGTASSVDKDTSNKAAALDETSGAENKKIKGEVKVKAEKKQLVLTKENLLEIHEASIEMGKVLIGNLGVSAPLFSRFVNPKAAFLIVDVRRNKFVEVTKVDEKRTERSIQFSSKDGKQMIDYLMVVLPGLFPQFTESPEYKSLSEMNLLGRLTQKVAAKGKKTREVVLTAAFDMNDVYVVRTIGKRKTVLGKLLEFKEDELLEEVMQKVEGDELENKYIQQEGISFYIAKDTNPGSLNSVHTLFQKMSGSLAYTRFSKIKKKKLEVINVDKKVKTNGMVHTIKEVQKAIVLDELCTFNGGGSIPFSEEIAGSVLKSVFAETNVIHKTDGMLEDGEDVSDYVSFSYITYAKSMSQARSNGAVGFKTLEDVVLFYLGTGQDELAYTKKHKVPSKTEFETLENGEFKLDKNGEKIPKMVESGFNVMDVGKAYKRFMLGASNGQAATKGWLSTYNKPKVEYFAAGERVTIGEIKPAHIVLTNAEGEEFKIALIDEFYSQIQGEDFLLNVLDENNAFVGVEVFKQWDNEYAAEELLKRNLTDGQGWHKSTVTKALRDAGVTNSMDSMQIRLANAVKGASLEFDPICDLLDADLILTDGMVKAEQIVNDIKKNGFQLFVVGQRKDSPDGIWLASQATQQLGMTEDELKEAVTATVKQVKKTIKEQQAGDILSLFDVTEEESKSELEVFNYFRLAEEFGEVLDDQYLKDQIASLGVKQLNKLLNGKFFCVEARTRYMFTDVFAIYNAAKDGRYTVAKEDAVLKPYEIIAPAIEDGKATLKVGRAFSNRFPVTITHEQPLVTAVHSNEYMECVKKGLWQGVTFFDAFSWVVALQAGADHDGDTSAIVFTELVVEALSRKRSLPFGNLPVLPFIDAFVKYNEDGEAIEFGTGCPTYETSSENDKPVSLVKDEGKFLVDGNSIIYDLRSFKGKHGYKTRKEFIETVANMSRQITLDTIEASLIGVIANRAMVLTDLLTRDALTPAERIQVEVDLLHLCTAGRWEIDRPKHGGAYLKMPLMEALFEKFSSVTLKDNELKLSDEAKREILIEEKGHYHHIFEPVMDYFTGDKPTIKGFSVKKPQWLASQKDEFGVRNEDSLFQKVFGTQGHSEDQKSFSESVISTLCEELKVGHSNVAQNNIRRLVIDNMELTIEQSNFVSPKVQELYAAYSEKERFRGEAEKAFRKESTQQQKKDGMYVKKNMKSLTKAKKTAKLKLNEEYKEILFNFSNERDLYRAQFRKAMYELAKELGIDVRILVGTLYLNIIQTKTNGSASSTKDGREFRFVPSNGFIALPFEVFADEMSSLISGKISETYFIPQDLTFALLESNLIEKVVPPTQSIEVKVRVLNPNPAAANMTVELNRKVRLAIKPELQNGETRLVMYFLKKEVQVTTATEVTREDAAYIGFAPEQAQAGLFECYVQDITFNAEGTVGSVRL